MSYYDAINYLYGLQKHGIKLGLEKIEKILSLLGDPQRDFLSVHVAGTNGKGSTSAMIASILMAHGLKVGLFTSPHLVSFTERIVIDNRRISESDVVTLTEEIRSRISDLRSKIPEPTFFEFVTAMAFLYFSRSGVDWAVIETGMGGRLDATNIITPNVSVITKIGYDHKEFLGETIAEIAREKAGIIKPGVPVVSDHQEEEARDVIIATANERSCPIYIYGEDFEGILKTSGLSGITFDYHDYEPTGTTTLTDLRIPLAGEYQLSNACIATKAASVALRRQRHETPASLYPKTSSLRDGLANTKWRGRLEVVSSDPLILIDGAHNPDAARALSGFIKRHLGDHRIILIMGIMSDKDIHGIMSPLLSIASEIIFTAPNYERASSPQRLREIAWQMGFSSRVTNSIREAIAMARDLIPSLHHPTASPLILITGSLYTIGEAMEVLGEKAVLGRLSETA